NFGIGGAARTDRSLYVSNAPIAAATTIRLKDQRAIMAFPSVDVRPDVSTMDLDRIVLDHHVGQQPFSGVLEGGFRFGLVDIVDFDVEHLALTHAGNAGDAERFQGALDRLALRIEDTGFESDGDSSFHAAVMPAPSAGIHDFLGQF